MKRGIQVGGKGKGRIGRTVQVSIEMRKRPTYAVRVEFSRPDVKLAFNSSAIGSRGWRSGTGRLLVKVP